jgi:cell division protein FtsZ
MTLFEVDQAANRIREEVADDANIIFGSAIDDNLAGRIRVSVVATGIDTPVAQVAEPQTQRPRLVAVGGGAPVPLPVMAQSAAAIAQPMPIGGAVTAMEVAAPARHVEVVQLEAAVPGAFTPASFGGAAVTAPPASLPPRSSSLFTEAPRPAPAAVPAPSVNRPSIFGRVTGGWRKPAESDQHRTEPQMQEAAQQAVVVRQAGPDTEAQGLDIPAFLRRQSN